MSSSAVTQVSGAPAVTITTTAETAAVTSGALAYNAPGGQGIWIQGTVTGATGAGVTSTQVRVRSGSGTGGTLIPSANGVMQEAQGASSFYSMTFSVLDPSPPASAVYTVTVQMVGATGNSTVTLASIGLEAANAAGT